MRRSVLLPLLALICAGTIPVWSQTITGSITGTVTDPASAAVPNVRITALNSGTNVTYSTTTNEVGRYDLLFLPQGDYTITGEAQGFKKAILGPFKVDVNQTARVDVTLQVGQVTESVEIKDVAPVLQTDNTQTGDVLTTKRLTEIPLNGRNFVSLTFLIPGAITTNPNSTNTSTRFSGSGGRPFVNGNREQTNNFLLDGVDINDSMDNRVGYNPSVDALQEVQVITGNGSSEFGNSAGAVVNMTIRSGTNQFHGTLFEFLRNEKLDANGFFNNRTTNLPKEDQRRAFRQNIYGFSLGGPIFRNKLFFFTDFEGTRRRDSGPSLASVAPLAWRTGNLSAITTRIVDPTTCTVVNGTRTCQQFPNNVIPPSRIVNPVAQALFSNQGLYPAPNQAGTGALGQTNNYTGSQSRFLNNDQGDVKVDYRLSDRDAIMARYSQGYYTDGTGAVVLPTLAAGINEAPTKGAVASWTRSVSPTIVNDFRFGFTRTVIINTFGDPSGFGLTANSKIGIPGSQPAPGFSSVAIGNGLTTIGTAGVLSDGKDNKFHFSETLTLQRGRHLLKVGGNGIRFQQNRFYSGNNGALGSFTYDGRFTGDAFADFLLDQLATKGRGQADGRRWGQRHWRTGIFFQDDFRVRSNLTLNLGLRWEYTQPLYEVNDLQANIDQVTGQLKLAGQNGNSRALYNAYYKQFMPRVGFAWLPSMFNKKLVVRAAYGITSFLEGTGVNLRLPLNPPFFYESNVIYADLNSPGSIRAGFTDLPNFSGQLAGNIRTWDPNLRPQFTQQKNVSVEYQFTNSLSLTTAWVGQNATHTIVARDINQPLPGTGPASTWASAQTRRPLYNVAPLVTTTSTTESSGTMDYNALQVSARQRFAKGIDFIASYTWSKTLNDALGFFGAGDVVTEGPYWQNSYDRNGNRGPAGWDARHNFSLGGNIEVPVGKGRAFGSNINRVVDTVIGGWSIGYILSTHTGFPITMQGIDRSLQAGRGTARPNRLRAFNTTGRSIDNWFGTANNTLCPAGTDNGICAYQDPTAGTFGNSGIGTERMPSYFNFDASVNKRFYFGETRNLMFRAEFFNLPNSVAFGPPARNITAANFGQIITQVNSPRNIQLGLKFSF